MQRRPGGHRPVGLQGGRPFCCNMWICTPAPKHKTPPLYCYIGIGIDRQPNRLVVRTNDPALTVAVATVCRILGLHFPGNIPVELTVEERIDADPEMQPVLNLLTWLPWPESAPPVWHGRSTLLDHLLLQFSETRTPAWQPPATTPPASPANPPRTGPPATPGPPRGQPGIAGKRP